MKSYKIVLTTALSAAMAAGGLMAAETSGVPHHRGAHEGFAARISDTLNLTAQQKEQAKNIFTAERQSVKPVVRELRQERKAVRAAIKEGKPATEVQKMAQNEGPQLAKLAGMRAATSAKFYAILTPAQQQKLSQVRQNWKQHRRSVRSGAHAATQAKS